MLISFRLCARADVNRESSRLKTQIACVSQTGRSTLQARSFRLQLTAPCRMQEAAVCTSRDCLIMLHCLHMAQSCNMHMRVAPFGCHKRRNVASGQSPVTSTCVAPRCSDTGDEREREQVTERERRTIRDTGRGY